MPRVATPQLNIRSRFARDRVVELARRTGMTATQVVEEALRAYAPPTPESERPDGLIRKGRLLVIPARGRVITLEETNAAVDAAREERLDAIG